MKCNLYLVVITDTDHLQQCIQMSKMTMAYYVKPRIQQSKIESHSIYIKKDQEGD